jgi:hypothetical protein
MCFYIHTHTHTGSKGLYFLLGFWVLLFIYLQFMIYAMKRQGDSEFCVLFSCYTCANTHALHVYIKLSPLQLISEPGLFLLSEFPWEAVAGLWPKGKHC